MFGMMVKIVFAPDSPFGHSVQILRNVTEVHYNYNVNMPAVQKITGPMVAFESDLHKTGVTHRLLNIREFEVFQETELADEF